MTDIWRMKEMLNFALSLILNEVKSAPSIYAALKAPILIRNDSITSKESKAEKMLVNILYVVRVTSILVRYGKIFIYEAEF